MILMMTLDSLFHCLPFVAEHPCDAGSTLVVQVAYDIVRPLTNSQMREFISLTSSLTSDACNFTASVDSGLDSTSIALCLSYKMPAA